MCHYEKYIKGTYSAQEELKGRERNYVSKRLSKTKPTMEKKN
jgi:hypothetical protein